MANKAELLQVDRKLVRFWILFLIVLPFNLTYFAGLENIMPADLLVPVLFLLTAGLLRKRLISLAGEDSPVLWYMGLFTLVSIAALYHSGTDRPLLVAVIAQFYLVVLYLLMRAVIINRSTFVLLVSAWVRTSTVVSLIGLLGVLLGYLGTVNAFARSNPNLGPGAWRLVSVLGQTPNFAYSYLHIGFFLALGLLLARNSLLKADKDCPLLSVKMLRFAVAAQALALVLTYSRGLLGALFGMAIIAHKAPSGSPRRWAIIKRVLLTALAALFLYSSIFYTYTTDALFTSSQAQADSLRLNVHKPHLRVYSYKNVDHLRDGATYNRLPGGFTYLPTMHWYLLKASWRFFLDHPITGVGPGEYTNSLARLRESSEAVVPATIPSLKPHSTLMGTLAEQGLLGFVGLTILWIFILGLKRGDQAGFQEPLGLCLWAALGGYLLMGLNIDVMNFRWLWLLMALAVAWRNIDNEEYGQ
jgi:hypothetical protein